MNQLNIIEQLGDDADLLTKSDEWLLGQKLKLSQDMSLLAMELKKILLALQIKTRLQQTNLVAVRRSEQIFNMLDEIIEIMPLPDAVRALQDEPDHSGQLCIWAHDGYDVDTAMAMR